IFFGSRNNDSHRAYHAGMVYNNDNGKITLVHCVSGGVSIQPPEDTNTVYWMKKAIFIKKMVGEDLTENSNAKD
ncbi:MAG: hypothetical protein C0594_15230, partial [Marinilabiliales bacterium]